VSTLAQTVSLSLILPTASESRQDSDGVWGVQLLLAGDRRFGAWVTLVRVRADVLLELVGVSCLCIVVLRSGRLSETTLLWVGGEDALRNTLSRR